MKHCSNCKLDINTDEKICPLCQSKLAGISKPVFPVLKTRRNDLLLKRLLIHSLLY